jgi:phage/plasmid-like protein (TIGR03299 family)
MITDTDSMAYVGETPWHKLGFVLPRGVSTDDAVRIARMDYPLLRAKVRYPVRPEDAADPSAWRTMDDRHVLVRGDNGDAMAIVSEDYKVVQPREVVDFFQRLCAEGGFELETLGTLYGGRKYWALARIGESSYVRDPRDKMMPYALLSSSCDGSSATDCRYTCVRVVCANTLGVAHRGAPRVKVTHRSVFDANAVRAEMGLDKAHEDFQAAIEQFRVLASVPVKPVDVVRETAALIVPGFDEMSIADQVKAVESDKRVARIGQLAFGGARGSQFAGAGGTAWGWLNAVTEYVDHEARARTPDARFDSAVFGRGEAVKQRALQVAMTMADGSTVYRDAPVADVSAVSGADDMAGLLAKPSRIK